MIICSGFMGFLLATPPSGVGVDDALGGHDGLAEDGNGDKSGITASTARLFSFNDATCCQIRVCLRQQNSCDVIISA